MYRATAKECQSQITHPSGIGTIKCIQIGTYLVHNIGNVCWDDKYCWYLDLHFSFVKRKWELDT